jgi:hypothetical protein
LPGAPYKSISYRRTANPKSQKGNTKVTADYWRQSLKRHQWLFIKGEMPISAFLPCVEELEEKEMQKKKGKAFYLIAFEVNHRLWR